MLSGMEVEACFRKIFEQDDGGIISYGFKFRPSDGSWVKDYDGDLTKTIDAAREKHSLG
jgi:hypothetical protein